MRGFRRFVPFLALLLLTNPCRADLIRLDPSFAQSAPDSAIRAMRSHMDDSRIEPWQRDIMRQMVQAHDEVLQGVANPLIPQFESPKGFRPPAEPLNVIGQPYLESAYSIYDPIGDRMLVASHYSGVLSFGLGDLSTWQSFDISGPAHPVTNRSSAIYDPVRARMLIFGGGYGGGGLNNEVWALSLSGSQSWSRLLPTGSPPAARYGHCAIYDPVRDRMIIFGGFDGSAYRNDTWALTLSGTPQWSELTPGMVTPRRGGASGIYDAVRDRLVITSGADSTGNGLRGDTWALSLSSPENWIALNSTGPSGAYGVAVYDGPRDQMVFSPNDGRTWTLAMPGTGLWQQLSTATSPAARWDAGYCYDSSRHHLVMTGGTGYGRGGYLEVRVDTWTLSLDGVPSWSAWSNCQGTTGAEGEWNSLATLSEPLYGSSATYDPLRNRALIFGGINSSGSATNHLWQLSLGGTPQWSALDVPGDPPGPRYGHGAAYDAARDRLLVFGGYGSSTIHSGTRFLSDVWAVNLSGTPGWNQIQPTGTSHPLGRIWTQAAYDPIRDRLLVFGGDSTYITTHTCCADCYPQCCGSYQERTDVLDPAVWGLNLSGSPAWSAIATTGPVPSGRFGHGLVYDPQGDRLITHGGAVESFYHLGYDCRNLYFFYFDVPISDTWAFNLSGTPGWSQLATAGCPPEAREFGTLIKDSTRNRLLLTGGDPSHTTWTLPLEANASWIRLAPDNESASNRAQAPGFYDPAGDRMVLVGGLIGNPGLALSDAWAQQFSGGANLRITTPAMLPIAGLDSSYSITLSAAGGTPPYAWRASPGTMPPGFTITSAGLLSGTAHAINNYTPLLAVTDAQGAQVARVFSLVSYAAVRIQTPSPLPQATTQVPYSLRFTATGGRPPFSWTVASGQLPQGLTLDLTGLLQGTTLDTGLHAFTVQVSDSSGLTAANPMSLDVVLPPLQITNAARLPQAVLAKPYQAMFTSVGGLSPLSWSLLSGALPAGLSLTPSGSLAGSPTTRQTVTFQIKVTDLVGNFAFQACSLKVDVAPLQITSPPFAPAVPLNYPFAMSLDATGGTPPYTWSHVSGVLPPGIQLTPAGVLQGTATMSGAFNFVVSVRDTEGTTVQLPMALTVGSTLAVVTTSPLTTAEFGFQYQQFLQATGGIGAYTWTLTAGTLPGGLALDAQGFISGTPTVLGISTFTLMVTDGLKNTASASFTLSVTDSLFVRTQTLPQAVASQPYSFPLMAGGAGFASVSWILLSIGALPPGFNLQSDGLLVGTTTLSGTYGFSVRAIGANGSFADASLSLVVVPSYFQITSTSLAPAFSGEAYLDSLHVLGGAPPLAWFIESGLLPSGMQLGVDGVLSGVPSGGGDYPITFRVTDAQSVQLRVSLVLHLTAALAITPPQTLPSAFAGALYSSALNATGGAPPYSWMLTSGSLPPGINLQYGGAVQGSAAFAGGYDFTARVHDSRGSFADGGWSLRVQVPNPLFTRAADASTGGGPSSVLATDLSGDGRPDILTSNFGAGTGTTLTLLRGQGAGSFGGRADYSAGAGPRAMAISDLDGIAGPEVAVADWTSGYVSVLSLTGGILSFRSSFFGGFYPSDIGVADLDGDGFPDIAVSNFGSSNVAVLFNQGDGTFSLGSSQGTAGGPMHLVLADMNGDGVLDALTANPRAGTVSYLKNRGDGSFLRRKDLAAGISPRDLAALDVDRDGIPDIVVADSAGGVVRILRGLGAGNFAPPLSIAVGLGPVAIAAADLDADGIADLVVANSGENSISMLQGRGDGTFFERTDSPTGSAPIALAVGDFNADGRPDVAVLCSGNQNITVLLNTGVAITTPVAVSDLEAEWSGGGVMLRWHFFGEAGSPIRVQRAGSDHGFADVSGDLYRDSAGSEMNFLDASAIAGEAYCYRLQWSEHGAPRNSPEFSLGSHGASFTLGEPVPNPTRGNVLFKFSIPAPGTMKMEVLDVSGRRVRMLLDAGRAAGDGTVTWDGRASDGTALPTGLYFARLEFGGRTVRRRMMLLK